MRRHKFVLCISKSATPQTGMFFNCAGDFVRLRERRDSVEPPNSFLCPITCEIMADPVMDADGNTYERWAITRWLEKSQQSPITRMPIGSRMLVPNRALKAIIDDWRQKNNVPLPSMRSRPASVSMSNRSGTSADRRVSRGGSSSRNRIGFRVSTLNVVLVAGAFSELLKMLNSFARTFCIVVQGATV